MHVYTLLTLFFLAEKKYYIHIHVRVQYYIHLDKKIDAMTVEGYIVFCN